MKLIVLAAAAALLTTPVFAQGSAVQGRSGSTGGGYRTDQGSGPTARGTRAAPRRAAAGRRAGTRLPPSQQGSGSNSGGYGPTRQ